MITNNELLYILNRVIKSDDDLKMLLISDLHNWYCNKLHDEPNHEFVIRSIAKTREYINNYYFNIAKDVFFKFIAAT